MPRLPDTLFHATSMVNNYGQTVCPGDKILFKAGKRSWQKGVYKGYYSGTINVYGYHIKDIRKAILVEWQWNYSKYPSQKDRWHKSVLSQMRFIKIDA